MNPAEDSGIGEAATASEDSRIHEATTALRSELAAMRYKRDRLSNELQDVKSQLKCKDERAAELQSETDQIKERAARQNAVIASLKIRIEDVLVCRKNKMPGGKARDEKAYASCEIIPCAGAAEKGGKIYAESAVRRFTHKYDNYHEMAAVATDGTVASYSDSMSGSSVDTTEISVEEKLKIDICYRGLKTQVFVCNSLANLYYGDTAHEGSWELRYTGIPVVLLDAGETRSRNKRRIQLLLAERGTCFALWQDTIDNLSSYKVAGEAFHTMFLSSDHRKIIGLSFDCGEAAREMWSHVERLTSCPENISLSVPAARQKKAKKVIYPRLPEKSHISQPCCFQHITNVIIDDRSRYYTLKTLLPADISYPNSENSSSDL